MIYASWDERERFYAMHPLFRAAFEFIGQCRSTRPPVGEVEIDGRKLYALVQQYTAMPPEQPGWEGHRRYIDIQYILSGQESNGWAPLTSAGPDAAYDETIDLLRCQVQPDFYLPLHQDQFAIYYPEDLHKPKCILDEACPVEKLVIKVAID